MILNAYDVFNYRYGWISEPLAKNMPHEVFETLPYEDLIPLETDGLEPCGDLSRPRVVVGHNVSFDRAKIKEQYWLERTGKKKKNSVLSFSNIKIDNLSCYLGKFIFNK